MKKHNLSNIMKTPGESVAKKKPVCLMLSKKEWENAKKWRIMKWKTMRSRL